MALAAAGCGVAQAQSPASPDLSQARGKLERTIKPEVLQTLSDGQYAALMSLAFSMPSFDKRHARTLIDRLNAGDLDGARSAIALYDRLDGWSAPGLAARRADEMRLWDTGKAAAR
jgi:GH24 family phage-related lysozyme (muramidase)